MRAHTRSRMLHITGPLLENANSELPALSQCSCRATGKKVASNEEPYRGMDQDTNFVEYDGQLVDEDPAGRYPPPDSRCRPALSGGRPAR